jgi:hypothetical protein
MINEAEDYRVFARIRVLPSLGGGEMWGGCDIYHVKIGRPINTAWPCLWQ